MAVSALLGAVSLIAFVIGAVVPGLCIAIMALTTAGSAVPILASRVELRHNGLLNQVDPPRKTSLTWGEISGLVTRGGLLTECVVEVDPIWHHERWPGRLEADRLPDACQVFVPTAAELFPKLSPQHSPARSTGFIQDKGCEWGSSSLSVDYTLFRYALVQDGGIEQAKEWYGQGTSGPAPDDKGATRLPGIGDEAVLTVSANPRDAARAVQTQVAARRANVVVHVVYMPPAGRDGKDVAVTMAGQMARDALSKITLR